MTACAAVLEFVLAPREKRHLQNAVFAFIYKDVDCFRSMSYIA